MAVEPVDLQEARAAAEQALAQRDADALADLLLRLPARDATEVLDALDNSRLAQAVSLFVYVRSAQVI